MELQPLVRVESPQTTLSTLPHDVVRIIIRDVGPPVEGMRLIGRNWNAMVLEYLSDRRNHPPLEEVSISDGGPEQQKRVKVGLIIRHPSHKHHFRSVCRSWKTTQLETFMSPILQLRTIELKPFWQIVVFLYFIFAEWAIALRLHYYVSAVIAVFMAALLIYLFVSVRPKTNENRDFLSKIFARCSSINELSLIQLNRETLDVVREILRDVPIKHLIVYDDTCDEKLRKMIVEMAGVHKVDMITVCAKTIEQKRLGKFFLDVTQTANELEIYETTSKEAMIFGKMREFWEKKAKDMSDGSFSVEVMNGVLNDELRDVQRLRLKIRS